jgi:hypothetical protein
VCNIIDLFTTNLLILVANPVKAHFRRFGHAIRAAEDPITVILDACGCITAQMARGWFLHAGYIW